MVNIMINRSTPIYEPYVRKMRRKVHPIPGGNVVTRDGMKLGFITGFEPSVATSLISHLEESQYKIDGGNFGPVARIEFMNHAGTTGAFLFDSRKQPVIHVVDADIVGQNTKAIEVGRAILKAAGVPECLIERVSGQMPGGHYNIIIFTREAREDFDGDVVSSAPALSDNWLHLYAD